MDGATEYKNGNVSETYRGMVRTGEGLDEPAFLKDLPSKELANEVFAAAIGAAIGLPIPKACIAFASSDRLPAKNGPVAQGGRLLFASLDVAHPPVAMLLSGSLAPMVAARLSEWPGIGELYGFDSLVANIDRHAGNLLFGGDRQVWLIDHGYCFTGPTWRPEDLAQPDRPVRNRLKEWLTPLLDTNKRSVAAGGASQVSSSLSNADIVTIAEANYVADLLDAGEFAAVVTYLRERRPFVVQLAAAALEMLA